MCSFFFIISGFVIFFTLCKSNSILFFLKKRVIRLVPTLVICSVITYSFVELFKGSEVYKEFHAGAFGFIPSWLFIDPPLLNYLFKTDKFTYIDGAYWSLLVEVKFYIIAGCIYFIKPDTFLRNWLIITITVLVSEIILRKYIHDNETIKTVWRTLFFTDFIGFFSLGIFFYALFTKIEIKAISYLIMVLIFAITFNRLFDLYYKGYFVLFMLAFVTLVYFPKKLSFLDNKAFNSIGKVSYSLYLLHQNIGVILLSVLLPLTDSFILQLILPILITCLFIGISHLIAVYLETPVNKLLKTL